MTESRVLLETLQWQHSAIQELNATNAQLQSLLDDLTACKVSPVSPLARIGPMPAREAPLDCEGLGPDNLKTEAQRMIARSREAILQSVCVRERTAKVREALRDLSRRAGSRAPEQPALSKREREVLKLIVAGKTSKEIAVELGISFKTAVTHRASLMGKLDVHEIASVVREALERGLV